MDSKTKAVAARIPLEDYEKMEKDTQKLGIKVSEWLIKKIYGYPLVNLKVSVKEQSFQEQETSLLFPDQKSETIKRLLEENEEIERLNKGFIDRIHRLQSANSAQSQQIEQLEFLLSKYNRRWQNEYDDLFGI